MSQYQVPPADVLQSQSLPASHQRPSRSGSPATIAELLSEHGALLRAGAWVRVGDRVDLALAITGEPVSGLRQAARPYSERLDLALPPRRLADLLLPTRPPEPRVDRRGATGDRARVDGPAPAG